jgi:DNA invertase Pin-like site-specific DNA recombinase
MVTDTSRWSRDNAKSKEYLEVFRQHGIKFFVGTMELDLFVPQHTFILGIGAEVNEYFAREQAYKSIINRIERAKKGYPSSSGRFPYGRIFDNRPGKEGKNRRGCKALSRREYLSHSSGKTIRNKPSLPLADFDPAMR